MLLIPKGKKTELKMASVSPEKRCVNLKKST